jgi:hypothetical protein
MKFNWMYIIIFVAAFALGYLISDYVSKECMDKLGVKKTYGIFQG